MNVVNHHHRYYLYDYYFIYCFKVYRDIPDSDIDGDEDVLHADEDIDAPDTVV